MHQFYVVITYINCIILLHILLTYTTYITYIAALRFMFEKLVEKLKFNTTNMFQILNVKKLLPNVIWLGTS